MNTNRTWNENQQRNGDEYQQRKGRAPTQNGRVPTEKESKHQERKGIITKRKWDEYQQRKGFEYQQKKGDEIMQQEPGPEQLSAGHVQYCDAAELGRFSRQPKAGRKGMYTSCDRSLDL